MMTHPTARRNPYIIGRPIFEQEKFFGRESLFQYIQDCLIQGRKVLLLYGQRRIGMSSILRQIPKQIIHDDFVFVNFDLQDKSTWSLGEILSNLATVIADEIILDDDDELFSSEELKKQPDIFSNLFLPKIYKNLGNKNLVLMLDEFDVIDRSDNTNILNHGDNFFDYLKSLVYTHNQLFIIPVLGRHHNDLNNLLKLFKNASYQEIGLLDELSARRLINKPTQGILEYEEEAIDAIIKLSAGHPYFTQVICFILFANARTEDNWKITRTDVEASVDRAIESAEGGLSWFWDGLTTPQKVIVSAVAEAQNNLLIKEKFLTPLELLKEYGVVETEELIQASKQLSENDLLDETQSRIKIEFIRRWLEKRHALGNEIKELEKLNTEEINFFLQNIKEQNQDDFTIHEQILKINPNHFSTIPLLAEEYLKTENFDKAIEQYQRAYQLDPIRNKESLLQALEIYGNSLVKQQAVTQAIEQFKKVLELEPDRISAKQKLLELEAEIEASKPKKLVKIDSAINGISNKQHKQEQLDKVVEVKNAEQRKLIFRGFAGIITCVGIGVALSQLLLTTPCSTGERNAIGLCVRNLENRVSENISSGERILFPYMIRDARYEQAIVAFRQGNYSLAAQSFEDSIKVNINDPESLIYYNNALARQQGNPVSLAVVVPANNRELAQEILRGVAQAQHQFNQNANNSDNLQRRLLEVVIANDADDQKQAQQIAAELVKNSSILGVIGHSSNDTTQAALDIYEKAGIATVSPSSMGTFSQNQVFFRTVPSNAAIAQRLAEHIKNSLGFNRVVIFYNQSENSKNLSEEFINHFQQLKGVVVRKIDLAEAQQDVEEEVKNIQSQAQAAVVFPELQDISVALEIAQANTNLISDSKINSKIKNLTILGETALYRNKTLKDGKQAIEGLILAIPWSKEAPKAGNFLQATKRQWGRVIGSWRTATSYNATQALIASLSSNPSRSNIIQNLRQINLKDSETSGYPLKFTQDGEPQNKPILVKVEKGRFQLLQQEKGKRGQTENNNI